MKLMIDIPEKVYKRVLDGKWEGNPLADYIEKGKPLQKVLDDVDLITVTDIREDGSEFTYVAYDELEEVIANIVADKEGETNGNSD